MSTIIDLLGQQAAHKEIVLEGLRPLPDNWSEVTMYISQPTSLGNRERISANVVFNFLQTNKVQTHSCVCVCTHVLVYVLYTIHIYVHGYVCICAYVCMFTILCLLKCVLYICILYNCIHACVCCVCNSCILPAADMKCSVSTLYLLRHI